MDAKEDNNIEINEIEEPTNSIEDLLEREEKIIEDDVITVLIDEIKKFKK